MQKDKGFWIGLSLINLTVVALLGLLMRSKFIFSLPFLDYRNLLSAHSYFALNGWVGLALLAMLVYDVLPIHLSQKKKYYSLLWGVQAGAAGMVLCFLFLGHHAMSFFFMLLYYAITFVFGWVFLNDLNKAALPTFVCWLSVGAIVSLLLSSLGPFGISYIMLAKSSNSLLYRDLSYAFLHLQYNGFFTLAIFAVFFSWCNKKGIAFPPAAKPFSLFLLLSVLPSLFLALLWHNLPVFYLAGAVGFGLIIVSVGYFVPVFRYSLTYNFYKYRLTKILWITSFISFVVKMVLTTGTINPELGNAVYGARPIIIGFMHLVFLAFASFFILSLYTEQGYFSRDKKVVSFPFYFFGAGVIITELLLMAQGVEVMLHSNRAFYNLDLWVGAVLLFFGAFALMITFYTIRKR